MGRWPKILPPLTEEQQRVSDDFFKVWLETIPQRYGIVERFNHSYPLRHRQEGFVRTLDFGAGRGENLEYEDLSNQEYVAFELRPELAEILKKKFPGAKVVVGDGQKHIDFPDGYFDRVLAVHVLEHLPDLPRALDEIRRVLNPQGILKVMIPCEGGLAYTVARNISARPMFEKRYKQSYDWFVSREHINVPGEIIPELKLRFEVIEQVYFPLMVPVVPLNLIIGLTLKPLPGK